MVKQTSSPSVGDLFSKAISVASAAYGVVKQELLVELSELEDELLDTGPEPASDFNPLLLLSHARLICPSATVRSTVGSKQEVRVGCSHSKKVARIKFETTLGVAKEASLLSTFASFPHHA